jgi:elongator complex protein 4
MLTNMTIVPDRGSSTSQEGSDQSAFCHTFDLSKRLTVQDVSKINHIALQASQKPLEHVLRSLEQGIDASPPSSIHRLVMPMLLSPALWPPHASQPENFLRFLHALRSMLSRHASRLTAMLTLPLELFPRRSGLVRWAELLSDGVLELTPFPHLMDSSNGSTEGGRGNEEQPQGILKVHKLPITTERGEGGAGVGNSIGEDLAFTISRRKFVIKPFSLPPLEGDQEAQKDAGKLTGKDVEF